MEENNQIVEQPVRKSSFWELVSMLFALIIVVPFRILLLNLI